jgi:hypothetical protein
MLALVSERPMRERRREVELVEEDGLEGRSNVVADGDGVETPLDVIGRGADKEALRTGGVGSGLEPRSDLVGGVL